jgi:hypothetical protein
VEEKKKLWRIYICDVKWLRRIEVLVCDSCLHINEFVSIFDFGSIFVVMVSLFVLFYFSVFFMDFFSWRMRLDSLPKNPGSIFFSMDMFVFLCFGYGLWSLLSYSFFSIAIDKISLGFLQPCFLIKGFLQFGLINSLTFFDCRFNWRLKNVTQYGFGALLL